MSEWLGPEPDKSNNDLHDTLEHLIKEIKRLEEKIDALRRRLDR